MLLLLLTKITGSVDIFFPARILSILLVSAAVLLPMLGKAKTRCRNMGAQCVQAFFDVFLNTQEPKQVKIISMCGVGLLFGCSPILYFLMLDYQSFLKWNVEVFLYL
jgi:hypothetical protein